MYTDYAKTIQELQSQKKEVIFQCHNKSLAPIDLVTYEKFYQALCYLIAQTEIKLHPEVATLVKELEFGRFGIGLDFGAFLISDADWDQCLALIASTIEMVQQSSTPFPSEGKAAMELFLQSLKDVA